MQDVLMWGTGDTDATDTQTGTPKLGATAPEVVVEEEAITGPAHPPSLLGLIQSGIRDDREPPGSIRERAGASRMLIRGRCSTRATAASRSTPATGAPARSRCFGT